MRLRFEALVLAAVLASPSAVHAQNPPVTVSVDVGASRRAISPLIYGVHFADAPALLDLNATINRYGGNSSGRYNWEQNIDNRGVDYFFESIPYPDPTSGELGDTFIQTTKAGGAQPFLTMPMVGWVARTDPGRNTLCSFSVVKYGAQTGSNRDCGNGISQATGLPITPPTSDPNDASVPADGVFQQGWMQHVRTKWGPASGGGLRYWGLDNEPSIWHAAYWDVHPMGAPMDEVRDKMIDYGGRIKTVDSTARVLGPEEWGWDGYFYSGKDQQAYAQGVCGGFDCPDRVAHGGADYVPYLLDQLRQHDVVTGQRTLDMLTLHFYPQGNEFSNDVSPAKQRLRNRSTRGLWDPAYVNESYINSVVRLIPRMKDWVGTYYPGLEVGLTEYNWGAESHINGATAQADLLGIFGREGLDMAIRWVTPAAGTPVYNGFKMYRNYDGAKSTFGDTSVSATVPNPDDLAAFAAQRTGDGALTVMVISKVLSGTTSATINLANFAASGTAKVWQLTSTNTITRLADIAYGGASLTTTLPPQSITLFVVQGSGGGPSADLSITKTDGQATAAPGQLLTYTIVAANNGPNDAAGSTVTDTVPASLTGATWTCVGAGGGICPASGSGSINHTVNLPNGASVTYTLSGTVSANPTNLRNTATVAVPSGMVDPNPANNSATDADLLLCFAETVVVPDGRVTAGGIGALATAWFGASLKPGNSYSLELRNPAGTTVPGALTVFSGEDGCGGTSTVAATDTSAVDPGSGAVSRRVSFTASGTETFFRARLVNGTAAPVPYTLGWSDTTMYSPAWSTNGSFNTFYSFQNTTTAALNGRLTLLDTAGAVRSTFSLPIPSGQTTSTNTQALAVPRNQTGTARFTHDGPPGSIVAEAAIANFSISPAYVQPVKFLAVREAR